MIIPQKLKDLKMQSAINETNLVMDEELLEKLEHLIENYKVRKQGNSVPTVPLNAFRNKDLGILEIIVKYLKEEYSLPFNKIAKILKRDSRTVWGVYNDAVRKSKKKFGLDDKETIFVPCSVFSDRHLSPLESLTNYLKQEYSMSFKEISDNVGRSYKVVWASYKRGIGKLSGVK